MSMMRLPFMGLCLVGLCGSALGEEPATATPPAADIEAPVTAGYQLQPGDILQVSVWKEPDLTSEVLIRPDGGMSYMLAGEFHAAGHTVAELTATLQKRIRKYEPDAVVTVLVKATNGY